MSINLNCKTVSLVLLGRQKSKSSCAEYNKRLPAFTISVWGGRGLHSMRMLHDSGSGLPVPVQRCTSLYCNLGGKMMRSGC